jgi:hypothetical protein
MRGRNSSGREAGGSYAAEQRQPRKIRFRRKGWPGRKDATAPILRHSRKGSPGRGQRPERQRHVQQQQDGSPGDFEESEAPPEQPCARRKKENSEESRFRQYAFFASAHDFSRQVQLDVQGQKGKKVNPDKLKVVTTTDGKPPAPGHEDAPAPQPIDETTGQHGAYWVLKPEEIAKGFVKPVRYTYVHVGEQPKNPLRDLSREEQERYSQFGYVAFEEYPPRESSVTGRFWTTEQLQRIGCGAKTTMGSALAQTWARDPHFYGSTFCVKCGKHLPVREFVWDDGERLGE